MTRAKGEGSIYRRADGFYVAQVDLPPDPETGRRRRRRAVRKSKQAALEALTRLKPENGIAAAVEGITVAAWCDRWLEDCGQQVRIGELAPSTVTGYDTCVRVHIVPNLGAVRLDQLSLEHVPRMMRAIQAAGRLPTTARWARATLSSALSAAVADGLIEVNVARAARPPALPDPNPSYFSSGEMTAIAVECDKHRLGPMFVLSALTEMRASELRGLRWSDIDIEDGTYRVTVGLHRVTSKQAQSLGLEAGLVGSKPKNTGSGRATPLSPGAVELLKRHRKTQAAERLAAVEWANSDRVFTSTAGELLSSENVRRQWYRLLE